MPAHKYLGLEYDADVSKGVIPVIFEMLFDVSRFRGWERKE
jgi:hypothetical protein